MKHNIITSLAVAAALSTAAASAASVSNQSTITVDVVPFCSLTGPSDQVFNLTSGGFSQRVLFVQTFCNRDLPYTLESDAAANGQVDLLDANSGLTIPAFLRRQTAPMTYEAPWGSLANGEEWARVGTGGPENLMFRVDVNHDSLGGVQYNKPAIGTYTNTVNFTMVY